MKLYLIRHGEAEGNGEGRYIGWEQVPLTPWGRRQAEALARRLSRAPLAGVYCSDLPRTRETAAPVAAAHGLPVVPLPGLREANFGQWSGLTYDEIHARAPDALERWLADPERSAPPGGESLGDLRRRVLASLPRVDGAAVVTHGGPLRALLSQWLGCPFWSVTVPLASLTVVEWDGQRLAAAERVGDTAHLEGLAR